MFAQSLTAALTTVDDPELRVHSCHGYFLTAGESGVEILFEVERIRDGRSFATRTVKAVQRCKPIFTITVSFHKDELGPTFQTPSSELNGMLEARGLKPMGGWMDPELMLRALQAEGKTPPACSRADVEGATQRLTIAQGDYWSFSWCRHRQQLPEGTHESILAWISDSDMVSTVRRPHEAEFAFTQSMSLDHCIHYHRRFRVDEWLLFHHRTTVSAGARGLVHTEVFDRHGFHVATIAQEALVRIDRHQAKHLEERLAKQPILQGNLHSKL